MDVQRATDFALVVDEWFDGERRHRDGPSTLRVEGGRLAQVERGDFEAELRLRGLPVQRAAFAMPGLVDAHVHLFLDGGSVDMARRAAHLKQPAQALLETGLASAARALRSGVTWVRDAGDRHGINHRVRAAAADPASGLAAVRSAGLALRRPKRYGAFMATEVDDVAAMRRAVAEAARDSDEIKLILTGLIDFDAGAVTDEPQFTLDETRAMVEAAHDAGRPTFVHCSGVKGLEIASRAGVGSIEHGFFVDRETLQRMAERGIAWTPTFCPVHSQWSRPQLAGWPAPTVSNLRRILDAHAGHLQLAQRLGVRLLLGTDAGSLGVPHGEAVFDEIDRYLEAGLTLQQTLQAATATARAHFGAAARLEPGVSFDTLALDASPFADFAALRGPKRVWRGGHPVACA